MPFDDLKSFLRSAEVMAKGAVKILDASDGTRRKVRAIRAESAPEPAPPAEDEPEVVARFVDEDGRRVDVEEPAAAPRAPARPRRQRPRKSKSKKL